MRAVAWIATACVACGSPAKVDVAAPKPPPAAACTVNPATTRVLRALAHPVVVEAYVSRDTPAFAAFTKRLEAVLRAFGDASGGLVVTRTLETRTPADAARAEKLGIVAYDDAGKKRYSGLVITYGVERDSIPLLAPDTDAGLEFWIANKIRELYEKSEGVHHRIGLLVGQDETSLSEPNLVPFKMGKPSMREIVARNFPEYELVDVDLHGGDTPIDAALEGLVVTQPARDFTDAELRRIDDWVMRGRALVVFAGAVNVAPNDPKMAATLSTHRLDRLLDDYGIAVNRDVVLDYGSSYTQSMVTAQGQATVRFPWVLQIDDDDRFTGLTRRIDTEFAPFFRLRQMFAPCTSSLTLHPERQPGASMKVVARSTPHAVHETHDLELGLGPWRPHGTWAQFDVAAYAEGRLRSAFGAAVVPPGSTARVFVFSSAQLAANPFARAGNPPAGREEGDGVMLELAAPYADIQREAAPLLPAILVVRNVLDTIADGPALSAVVPLHACAGR